MAFKYVLLLCIVVVIILFDTKCIETFKGSSVAPSNFLLMMNTPNYFHGDASPVGGGTAQ